MIERLLDKIKIWHIVAACAVIYLSAFSKGLSLNGDDSSYILMGRSFLEKGFYHQLFFSDMLVKCYYYFMLPAILVPFLAFAPDNYFLMKLVPLVSALLAIILFNMFLKGMISDRLRKTAVLLFALNPWTVEYSGLILTDIPYLFSSLACLVFFKKYTENKKSYLFFLSVIFAGFSLYTRVFGAALCGALFAFSAVKKRWKECAVIFVILAIFSVPIFVHLKDMSSLYIRQFVKKQDYFACEKKEAQASQIVYRMGRTFLVYMGNYLPDLVARPLVSSIDPRLPDKAINPMFFLKFLLGAFLGGLILIGFFKTLQGGFAPYHLYFVFHLMINMIINIYVARYLVSLLPFILLFIVTGSVSADGILKVFLPRIRIGRVLLAALIALSIIGSAQNIIRARTGFLPAKTKSFVECNDWVKANLPQKAIVLSRKPSYTKVYTGREAVWCMLTDKPEEQLAYIMDTGAEYVIVGDPEVYPNGKSYLIKTIIRYPQRFRLRYTTRNKPEDYIYEVIAAER